MASNNKFFSHATIEKNVGILIILSILVVSFAGLVQIVPLFFQHSTTQAAPGVKPLNALQLVGRDVFIKEGCVGCHSQQVRVLASEVQRYGPYSVAAEGVYDYPFLWGSRRMGPDLARVGGRYSDDWHRIHLRDPRVFVKQSNMPAYYWLQHKDVSNENVQNRMKSLNAIHKFHHGEVMYSDEEIAKAPEMLKGKTEEDAVIAYLQNLGVGYVAALREQELQQSKQ
ncbi:cytochrome-c oxidase, cbb3-type subunit II [Pelistega sp. NLN82]|uniref:Cytochrome-c oxidase, cbb3-type subunit II n=1 Tax=Pelistega ratti TaxID=2652177 RepID=A0A6L9Y647_9BURK|nr:cytochrome-c oxidase, cbb3-type subunit II [Pelistega ratti]NEN75879.1 cytochrome-c oxidase, cbb3-type subunit II [Pelistega ratti]